MDLIIWVRRRGRYLSQHSFSKHQQLTTVEGRLTLDINFNVRQYHICDVCPLAETLLPSLGADGRHSCVGASRRYFSCNVDDCPPNSKDFRAEQCTRFNSVQYKGKYYSWIPYHNTQTPCELNCMPKGGNFYARLDRRVIDGTRCRDDGSFDVCVDGQCM
ncbi:Papilin, partial [Araneus ventricosus]